MRVGNVKLNALASYICPVGLSCLVAVLTTELELRLISIFPLVYPFFPYQFSCEFLSVCTFRNKSSGGWDCPLLFIGGNDGEELAGSVGLLILSSGFVPYLLWGWRKGAEIWPALCFSSQALRPWCVTFVLRALCCCDLEILKFCHVICYFERSAFCCCC